MCGPYMMLEGETIARVIPGLAYRVPYLRHVFAGIRSTCLSRFNPPCAAVGERDFPPTGTAWPDVHRYA